MESEGTVETRMERKRLANEVWEQMVEKAGHRCLKCGEPSYPMSQDHVVSVKDGGGNEAGNIQPLCLRCNLRKGDASEDYRPLGWPWREDLKPAVRLKVPGPEFLAAMQRINRFMAEWRKANPRSTFISAKDPHLRWMKKGLVYGECGACPGYQGTLTPGQVDKSVDNWVAEAHVAWHLGRELVDLAAKLEGDAMTFYLPEQA